MGGPYPSEGCLPLEASRPAPSPLKAEPLTGAQRLDAQGGTWRVRVSRVTGAGLNRPQRCGLQGPAIASQTLIANFAGFSREAWPGASEARDVFPVVL